ncbi:MAG: hypothetical protein K9N48_05815 [Verrucomicrobia bacterium]|nr:hypothetical protein [Verrucomicrobiota bacterium]MCF7708900.1 hypothetical protein [Verrucomicrobiota bacterium]
MQEPDFEDTLELVVKSDPRYARGAYLFVRQALEFTQQKILEEHKGGKRVIRHVSGRELLEGVREFALDEFGPMAFFVLEEWGIHKTEDVGDIVFNLVDSKLLSKTDDDSPRDFEDGYDFYETFKKPFLPKSKRERRSNTK